MSEPMTPEQVATPCDEVPCDTGPGEPCERHEREWSHADGSHELCGAECAERLEEIRARAEAATGAEFIAGARADLPALLAEVERLRRSADVLRQNTRRLTARVAELEREQAQAQELAESQLHRIADLTHERDAARRTCGEQQEALADARPARREVRS